MQIYRLKINKNLCIGCNDCVVSCPLNFQQLKEKGYLTKENAVVLVKNGMAYDIYVEGRDVIVYIYSKEAQVEKAYLPQLIWS